MLTIFFVFIFFIYASYTDTKYSDFGKNEFFQIRPNRLCYNKSMTEQLEDNSYDGPMCCAGCTCTTGHSSKPIDPLI